jgi:hypothetical protein
LFGHRFSNISASAATFTLYTEFPVYVFFIFRLPKAAVLFVKAVRDCREGRAAAAPSDSMGKTVLFCFIFPPRKSDAPFVRQYT